MARSYLFTPAHQQRLLARAHERGADVVLLDLEDSVPPDQKPGARAGLPKVVAELAAKDARVAVRVNAGLGDLVRDVEAACLPGVEALMLPKVITPDILLLVADHLTACEAGAGLPTGRIGLVALIETAEGLLNAPRITKSTPRLTALAFGTEDFSADCGFAPAPETLSVPAQHLIWAARAAGIAALGLPGSIADVADMGRFAETVRQGRQLGFDGVLCIHPRQVEVVNRIFTPDPADLEHARRVAAAYQGAAETGQGAVLLDGQMIDPPVVARALRLLRQSPGHTARA